MLITNGRKSLEKKKDKSMIKARIHSINPGARPPPASVSHGSPDGPVKKKKKTKKQHGLLGQWEFLETRSSESSDHVPVIFARD